MIIIMVGSEGGAVGTPLTPKYGIGILIIRFLGVAKDVYNINGFA